VIDEVADWEDVQIRVDQWDGSASGGVADHSEAFGL